MRFSGAERIPIRNVRLEVHPALAVACGHRARAWSVRNTDRATVPAWETLTAAWASQKARACARAPPSDAALPSRPESEDPSKEAPGAWHSRAEATLQPAAAVALPLEARTHVHPLFPGGTVHAFPRAPVRSEGVRGGQTDHRPPVVPAQTDVFCPGVARMTDQWPGLQS